MKKLLIATDCFAPRWDGISRFLLDIIPKLTMFDITVIAPDFKGEFNPKFNAKIIRIPLSRLKIGDFTIAKTCKKIIEPHVKNADIIWTHTLSTIGRSAVSLGKKYSKKNVFYIHSIDWELIIKSMNLSKQLKLLLYPFIRKSVINYYKKCDLILSPEKNVDNILEWHSVNVPYKRVKLGVNLQKFSFPEDKEEIKEMLKLPNHTIIGFCGRLSHEKDLETLLKAYKKIKVEYSNVSLLIVGSGLKEYEKKLHQEKGIIYVGQKDMVVPYLQAMDIFVLPSLVETTSLATLEAMACGAVPICTPVGYVKEYIKEKVNGMLFPFKNDVILYLKIKQLIENKHLKEELSRGARLTVQQKFCFSTTAEKIISLLTHED